MNERGTKRQRRQMLPWECDACGTTWVGHINDHQCKIPLAPSKALQAREARLRDSARVQEVWRAWRLAILEDAQREVDAIVTDDGA